MRITRKTSENLSKFTFEIGKKRKASGRGPGRVTSVDKANVIRAFAFFRGIFDEEAAHYPNLRSDHAYVDATALWLVEKPQTFDVMVTENMFGDILSDLGAGLMGGLGLAPSADIDDGNALSLAVEAVVQKGTKTTLDLGGTSDTIGAVETREILPVKDWPGFAGDCAFALQNHVVSGLWMVLNWKIWPTTICA